MNLKSPEPLSPNDFAHYVKLVNPTDNPTKHPLYTQTIFSRTMKSDKFTTASVEPQQTNIYSHSASISIGGYKKVTTLDASTTKK